MFCFASLVPNYINRDSFLPICIISSPGFIMNGPFAVKSFEIYRGDLAFYLYILTVHLSFLQRTRYHQEMYNCHFLRFYAM